MKRIGLFLLAVVMVAGLAGCPGKDHDADPVGTWSLDYTYTGLPTSTAIIHIHSNGTYIFEVFGSTGTWSVDGDTITMNGSMGSIYTGTVENDNAIDGTFVASDGKTGTWHASKISDTP